MSNRKKVTIGVIAAIIIVVGGGLLRWGSVVYWNSDGERGWSLGAAAYELLGWDSEAYRDDFSRERALYDGEGALEVRLVDEDGDGVPDRGVVETSTGSVSAFSHRTPFGRLRGHGGKLGGLMCLVSLALLGGLAFVFYRRRRKSVQG